MRAIHILCGAFANESEAKALHYIKSRLISSSGHDEWFLLTNLSFSFNQRLQSDEIDLVAIGPAGVRIVEIKHWSGTWITQHMKGLVEHEAEKLTNKARKMGTSLRKILPHLPFVKGSFLLTHPSSKGRWREDLAIRGIQFHPLQDWAEAIGLQAPQALTAAEVHRLSNALEPKTDAVLTGSLRRIADYINLELQTVEEQRFHRIFKGIHSTRKDKVKLHLYDLSAMDSKAEVKARRAYETLHRLQMYRWAPRILDSFQEAPGYTGEMYFFTEIDSTAPSLAQRMSDASWHTDARVHFAHNAVQALKEFHGIEDETLVLRNLDPDTLLVKHDNLPILSGFELAKIDSLASVISPGASIASKWLDTVAPEVKKQGLGAADQRTDVYALCASLAILFQEQEDSTSQGALDILTRGMSENPADRAALPDLEAAFSVMLGQSVPPPPPARFWSEGLEVTFRDKSYRIVGSLGSGGVGTTFKAVEIDQASGQDLGTYVAKVSHAAEAGQRVLHAYNLARSHLGRHKNLSAIFEVAPKWGENEILALLSWVNGGSLYDFAGVFPLLSENLAEASSEALALRWLRSMCDALRTLHQNGLVHSDVSPRNMIVSDRELVLIDYDFVTRIGEPVSVPGTVLYSPPETDRRAKAADDIYALAASFFHVLFAKTPFQYNGVHAKERGLNWEGVAERTEYSAVAEFLDRATHPQQAQRFQSIEEALGTLPEQETSLAPKTPQANERFPNQVDWLDHLLQSYPGSPRGNKETRGLDTKFAAAVYVPTDLEKTLLREIKERKVQLVVLCGNAGDGKTALLQHLATELEFDEYASAQRIIELKRPDGLVVRMNLDGAASWQGRSADELLNEFLAPFQDGTSKRDVVHLLAINDGRLLEWLETVSPPTPLKEQLASLLKGQNPDNASHIRFYSLNRRSNVGSITPAQDRIDTEFLEKLLVCLYGGTEARGIWAGCQTCSAQERCEVYRAQRIFGPDDLPDLASADIRDHARRRLFEALQAVHMRGEAHITVRELRSALVYILFGIHFCTDYHESSEKFVPYWERAFAPNAPNRQGTVLQELIQLDPALGSHPVTDRYLLRGRSSRGYASHVDLKSARRQAYFELTKEGMANHPAVELPRVGLAQGNHLQVFRDLALQRNAATRAHLRVHLCRGISLLEGLPSLALARKDTVPLRITPRTPTETVFWVEKPLDRFSLEPVRNPEQVGIGQLHRQVRLTYRFQDEQRGDEELYLGAKLFHLLLELGEGYQLGDVATDDIFANLSIFVQRIIHENERELFAWNPMQEETIYRVAAQIETLATGVQQPITIEAL